MFLTCGVRFGTSNQAVHLCSHGTMVNRMKKALRNLLRRPSNVPHLELSQTFVALKLTPCLF